jgi:hypothetical protein
MNVGSTWNFNGFLVGGGLIYTAVTREDILNRETLSANQLSLYGSLGFNNSTSSTGYNTFGTAPDSNGGLQGEFYLQRDPQVVTLQGSSQIVRPETSTLGLFFQYTAFSWFFNFNYEQQHFSPVTNFFNESSSVDRIEAGLGLTGESYVLTFYPGFQRDNSAAEREGFVLGANIVFSFGSVSAASRF